MTIAVLSDIHSNYVALRASIQAAKELGAEAFFFLGDYLTDCASPQRTLAKLRDLSVQFPCYFIRGNREDYLVDYRAKGEVGWQPGSHHGALLYTYQNVAKEELDWFASLPISEQLTLPGYPPVELCHGTPWNNRLKLATPENLAHLAERPGPALVLCGHTHRRGIWRVGEKRVINPGSVGLHLGTPGHTQLVLLHLTADCWQEEFLTVPYPVEETLRELESSGLAAMAPVWVAMVKKTLYTAENYVISSLMCAEELYRSAGGADMSHIPEEYFEQAARNMGICF